MKNWYILSLFLISGMVPLCAQKYDWKICLEEGKMAEENGNYFEAGLLFRQAYEYKSGKKDLLFFAGNAFFNARAYRDAAKAFESIHKKEKKYPLIGLKYARSLKQMGDYATAMEALKGFAESYDGPRSELAGRIIKVDIEGCEMALDTIIHPDFNFFKIGNLHAPLNTTADEINPCPFSDSIFFWISSSYKNGSIITAKGNPSIDSNLLKPFFLPPSENKYIGSFAASEDRKRIYFSKCTTYLDELGLAKESCSLFVTYAQDSSWSFPLELNDRINARGACSTYPFVYTKDQTEFLFFASDRRGTAGGLDIWYASRPLIDGNFEFSVPKNCGRSINSRGDEVTPWIRLEDSTLFFSSNAHPGLGGYDVFYAIKEDNNKWAEPVNLGSTVNSSANDYFYSEPESGKAYLVANRVSSEDPSPKRDYDIFLLENKSPLNQMKMTEPRVDNNNNGNVESNTNEATDN